MRPAAQTPMRFAMADWHSWRALAAAPQRAVPSDAARDAAGRRVAR
jgi:hypothetical protein